MKQLLLAAIAVMTLSGAARAQAENTTPPPSGEQAAGSAQEAAPPESPPPAGPQSEAPASGGAASSAAAAQSMSSELPPGVEGGTIPVTELRKPDETLPAKNEAPTELGEVVVTAQKTRQSARRVPISVTAMSGEAIQQTGAATLADVSLYLPNVRMDSDDLGSPQIFIRGFGTNSFNPSFEGSVALVQDEIYYGRPGYFTEAMFDIDRVEVLRGPQGTLFGKNSVAGVFNVVTKEPEGDLSADGRYFGGEKGEQRFEGGVGGMFADWGGARLSVLSRRKNGDLYNEFLNRDEEQQAQRAARLKLRLFPGFGFDSTVTAVTSESHAPFWPFQLMKLDGDTRQYLEAFDPNIEDNPLDFRTSFDTLGWINKGSSTLGWKTEWNGGEVAGIQDFSAVLVLGWSKFHIDQLNEIDVSPADIARLDNHEHHHQKSAELRFTGHADSLFGLGTGFEYVAGGFYYTSSYVLLAQILAGRDLGSYALTCDFEQLANKSNDCPGAQLGLPPIPALGNITSALTNGDLYRLDYDQDVSSRAVFGQFTWNLTEHVAITPGLRFSKEHKRADTKGMSHCQGKDAGLPQPCIMELLLSSADYDYTNVARDESDVSPKLALQWFGEEVNWYASYAKGYKSGGVNSISFTGGKNTDPSNPQGTGAGVDSLLYRPEVARTREIGAKGKFFERTLGINITYYQTRFDNLQVLAFNGVFFDVSNAGQARSSGIEADFLWLTPYAPLRLNGSVGLLDAKYLKYASAPAPVRNAETGQLQIGAKQDLAGKRIAFAPKQTATLTPSLTYPVFGLMATLAGDVLYQGDQFTDTDLDPATHVDAYIKYAARIILNDDTGNWSLSVGGSNLTDVRVLNQVTDATFFPGTFFAQAASGRQLFAVLSLKI